jgi:2-polyprenyl-3-methyl-5-hydroxy-6-metoxy-1,4-benzoquinol methylase
MSQSTHLLPKQQSFIISGKSTFGSAMSEIFTDDMLESIFTCPACYSDHSVTAVEAMDNLFFCSSRQWRYLRCSNCSSLYLNNRPRPDSIHLAYHTYYTHKSTTGAVNPLVIDLLRQYLRSIRDSTILGRLIGLIRPLNSFFEAKTRGVANCNPGQIFDFGCGNGTFLSLCHEAGWLAHGCDFDESAVHTALARGLNVVLGGIEALAAQPDDSFDLITLSHVIEHLHEPTRLLIECRKKLKKGGTLWLETPNANASGLRVFEKNWRGLEPPRHLLLYTRESLTRTLTMAQFNTIEEKSHFLSSTYIYVKSNTLKENRKTIFGAVCPALRGLAQDLKVMSAPETSEFLTITCKK